MASETEMAIAYTDGSEENRLELNEVFWWLLMPEFSIRVYASHFNIDFEEAERRLTATPILDDE